MRNVAAIAALTCGSIAFATNYTGEYFWNTDPGIGQANKIAAVNVGSNNILDTNVEVDGTHAGLNILGLRVFNGQWSPTIFRYVYISPDYPAPTSSLCEYFWDEDPGIGLAKQLTLTINSAGNTEFDIDTNGIATGLHILGLRTLVNGYWSPTTKNIVYVKPSSSDRVDAVEYFWGTDPGFGKGTAVSITPGEVVNIESLDLDFPAEGEDAYYLTIRAHSQAGGWGTSYIKEFVVVHAEGLNLDEDFVRFRTLSDTHQLNAEVNPDNTWENVLTWTSSDYSVVTVDSKGLLKPVADGEATITVSLKDTDYTAQCDVKVLDETVFPLGDSNGSGTVTVTDVAVTAAYTIGSDPNPFMLIPADVNKDDEISLSDIVGTVNIVLGLNPEELTRAPRRNASNCSLSISKAALMTNVPQTVSIDLTNNIELTGLQIDLYLPEGVELIDARLGSRCAAHTLDYNKLSDGCYRLVSYSLNNALLTGNAGEVLLLDLVATTQILEDKTMLIDNARAAERNGHEYSLPACTAEITEASGISDIDSDQISAYVIDRVLYIVAPHDCQVPLATLNGMNLMLDVRAGVNSYPIHAKGVYVVGDKKVIVK
ncbi:MAG: Ig-like domain-containing protein [Bacteroidales bacterium]|nr:Ig-like domain-containing protein [Bacteroidales bacterium]